MGPSSEKNITAREYSKHWYLQPFLLKRFMITVYAKHPPWVTSKPGWLAPGLLAHLVSQFACNTRVIVDASSNLPVSRQKISVTKKLESNYHANKQKLNVTSSINQMVIR